MCHKGKKNIFYWKIKSLRHGKYFFPETTKKSANVTYSSCSQSILKKKTSLKSWYRSKYIKYFFFFKEYLLSPELKKKVSEGKKWEQSFWNLDLGKRKKILYFNDCLRQKRLFFSCYHQRMLESYFFFNFENLIWKTSLWSRNMNEQK